MSGWRRASLAAVYAAVVVGGVVLADLIDPPHHHDRTAGFYCSIAFLAAWSWWWGYGAALRDRRSRGTVSR